MPTAPTAANAKHRMIEIRKQRPALPYGCTIALPGHSAHRFSRGGLICSRIKRHIAHPLMGRNTFYNYLFEWWVVTLAHFIHVAVFDVFRYLIVYSHKMCT